MAFEILVLITCPLSPVHFIFHKLDTAHKGTDFCIPLITTNHQQEEHQ